VPNVVHKPGPEHQQNRSHTAPLELGVGRERSRGSAPAHDALVQVEVPRQRHVRALVRRRGITAYINAPGPVHRGHEEAPGHEDDQ
jgi:hypothetical protein